MLIPFSNLFSANRFLGRTNAAKRTDGTARYQKEHLPLPPFDFDPRTE
jgi:hypothetical protein